MMPSANASSPSIEIIDAALRRFFAAHPPAGRRICVALSGGMDSVALLHALSRHRQRIVRGADLPGRGGGRGEAAVFALSALHVHHGLSPYADDWAASCAALCRDLGVALETVRIVVPRDSGEGLEAAARRGRYRAFAQVDADWLALAHHRDDQAETVLLNLLRGAGPAGAAGMPALRALGDAPDAPESGVWLIRPLLDAPRAAIEAYAAACGLRWVNDESNESRHFRRNFLRHEIFPALETPFPGARQALARAAGHFSEADALLGELAQIDAGATRLPSGRIGLAEFNRLAPARARNLLRHVWAAAGFRLPHARWLEEARRQLADAAAGAETCVATPEGELRTYRGELYCLPRCASVTLSPVVWCGEAELPWGAGCVRFERVVGRGIAARCLPELAGARSAEEAGGGNFEGKSAEGRDIGSLAEGQTEEEAARRRGAVRAILRARRGGERFRPQANRPRRALRNLLQEAGVPPWERTRMPLLWLGDRLAWVGGLGVDAGLACAPGESGVLPVWQPAQALQP